jgi:nicotinamidase-related amidase
MISPAQQHGFGNRSGFGLQAALLVVDFARGFTSPTSRLGADMAGEIVQANRLILATRAAGAPVYLSTIAYADPIAEAGVWDDKIHGLRELVLGSEAVEQDPRLALEPSDRVIVKRFASCFFGTTLEADLRRDSINTLIIAGCTTSGCGKSSLLMMMTSLLRASSGTILCGGRPMTGPDPDVAGGVFQEASLYP